MATEVLEKLRDIPFQKIKDSPTVKYYTDWKIFQNLLPLEYSTRYIDNTEYLKFKPDIVLTTDEAISEGGVVEYSIVRKGFRDHSKVYAKDRNVLNRMEAYHIYRNKYILKLGLSGEFGGYTILSPGPIGYLPNHLVINIDEGSKGNLNIVDLGLGSGLKTFFIEMNIANNSEVDVNYVFLYNRDTASYTDFSFEVLESSKLSFNILGFGGLMTHLRSSVELKGVNSVGYTYGSLIARNNTKTDVITNVTHHGDYSESILSVRGGILDGGYLVHRGAARILNISHEANTAVKSYLTIFGEKGTAHSIPMLEVDTGIVAGASHSTSVSRLDEYRLFYLRKMGLSDDEIIDMLLRAYVEYSGVAEIFDVDWRGILKD